MDLSCSKLVLVDGKISFFGKKSTRINFKNRSKYRLERFIQFKMLLDCTNAILMIPSKISDLIKKKRLSELVDKLDRL